MSLLDSDADELKNRGTTGGSGTGRKANQSGLGAFKSLSKYSNLTAKYRKPDSPTETKAPTPVEHSRGTFSDSSDKVSANTVQSPSGTEPTLEALPEKVSTCKVGAVADPISEIDVSAKSVQGLGEPELTLDAGLAKEVNQVDLDPNHKSVQSQCGDIGPSSNASKVTNNIDRLSASVESKASQCASALTLEIKQDRLESKPSADSKSVQDSTDLGITALGNVAPLSKCEVSTKNVSIETDKVSAKTVQSPFSSAPTKQDERSIAKEQGGVNKESVQTCTDFENSDNTVVELSSEDKNNSVRSTNVFHESSSVLPKIKSVQENLKVGADLSAKSVLHESIPRANQVQSPSEVGSKLRAQVSAESSLNPSAKIKATVRESLTPLVSILTVSGSQRKILEFLFDQCVWNNSLITPPITKEQLLSATYLKEETALSSVKRLRGKQLIDRVDYKDGKAGWTRYKLSEITYRELLNFRNSNSPFAAEINFANQAQNPAKLNLNPALKVSANVGAKVSASPPSKIDRENFNLSNLSSAPTSAISWFKTLDFSPVHPIGAMQVNSSIRNMVETRLEAEQVQSFISRFKNWLATQSRVNNPLGLFCDKLKELANEGDSPVLACMSDEERRVEVELLSQLEQTKRELELIEKAKQVEDQELAEEEFARWYATVSDSELEEMLRPNQFLKLRSEMYRKGIRGLFFEKRAMIKQMDV